MSISWGKLIGGIAAITGIAVAGVGLGGASAASALDGTALDGVGDFLGKAGEKIIENAASAAKSIGIEADGKTVAAVAGGAAAAIGGAAMIFSGKKDDAAYSSAAGIMPELQEKIKLLPRAAQEQLLEGLNVALAQAGVTLAPGEGSPLPTGIQGKGPIRGA